MVTWHFYFRAYPGGECAAEQDCSPCVVGKQRGLLTMTHPNDLFLLGHIFSSDDQAFNIYVFFFGGGYLRIKLSQYPEEHWVYQVAQTNGRESSQGCWSPTEAPVQPGGQGGLPGGGKFDVGFDGRLPLATACCCQGP